MTKFITYRRVSTTKQGTSGLGLEAQTEAAARYVATTGGKIIADYTEIESGTRSDRPELFRALAHAKRSKAVLVVAKIDRLSRNVAFLAALMESSVEFIACDMPFANRLTIHVLAAVAENEAAATSARTKAALAALKARGVKLGSARAGHWEGREAARLAGLEKARERSITKRVADRGEAYRDLLPFVTEQHKAGRSLRTIAAALNAEGHTTRQGKLWGPVQVSRLLAS